MDNEGEVIDILNQTFQKGEAAANMTFCGITNERGTSPVPRLNLTAVKFDQKKEQIDFETYSDKLEY